MLLSGIFLTGSIVLIIIFLMIFLKKEYHLYLLIALLLLLVSDINESLRIAVNISAYLYLGLLFLYKNQFFINRYPRLPKELNLFIPLYLSSLLLSTFFSVNLQTSIVQLSRVTAFFILIYLIYSEIDSEDRIKFLFITLIIASAVSSAVILFNFLFTSDSIFNIDENILMRAHGIYGNLNALGGLSVVSFLILFTVLVLGYASRYKKLIIFLLILNISGLILNNSRSSMIGIVSGFIVLLYIYRRKYLYIFFTSTAAILIIILLNENLSRIFDFYFRMERAFSGREYFWDMAVNMFADNWVFGIGPAGYKYQMYNYLPVMLGSWDEFSIFTYFNITEFGLQHNFYLFVLSELGIYGFLVCTLFFYLYFKKAVFLASSNEKLPKVIGIVGLSTGVGLLVRGFFESLNIFTYGWISGDLPFWIIVLSLFSIEKLFHKKVVY